MVAKSTIPLRVVRPLGHQKMLAFSGERREETIWLDNSVGELVRDLRLTLGLSLEKASKVCGWEPVDLTALEFGRKALEDSTGGFYEVCRRFIGVSDVRRKSSAVYKTEV